MKTEKWEDLFREKVNRLDSAPPQTGWNNARSWNKLEKQLASPAKPAGRRIAWWTYAAAAACMLLVPALLLSLYFQRQRNEIGQLKVALEKVKSAEADSLRRSSLPESLAGAEVPDTEPGEGKPTLSHREVSPVKEVRARPATPEKFPRTELKTEIREAPRLDPTPDERIAGSKPAPTDTAAEQLAVAPDSAPVVTFIRKAPKTPAGRKVVFVFRGNQVENATTHLAEAPPKPARKFIFLSGEKESSPPVQPEDVPSPFAFTVKPRKSLH
jgi:hypothetical protein